MRKKSGEKNPPSVTDWYLIKTIFCNIFNLNDGYELSIYSKTLEIPDQLLEKFEKNYIKESKLS